MINPFKNKKGLGRGLSSLIGDSDVKITNNKISISSIIPNKYQPRKNFDKNSLEELTASIRERGIIQPIIVRNSNGDTKYEIIAGERSIKNFFISGDGFLRKLIFGNLKFRLESLFLRWIKIQIICSKPANEIEKLKYLAICI